MTSVSLDDGELIEAETVKEIEHIARSPTRIRILRMASENGPTDTRTFRDELDASRTTIQRNVTTLVDRGWLKETEERDGYVCTPCGEILSSYISELVDSVRILRRVQPILDSVSANELDIDIEHLVNADVTVAKPNDPYAPVNRHVDALGTANEFRIFTAVVGRNALAQVRERVVDHDCEGEVVLTEDAVQTLRSNPNYAALFQDIIDTGDVDIYVYGGDLPYYLGLIDNLVQVGVEDENGVPKALLEDNSPAVREWAKAKYESYRTQAVTLE